MVIKHFKIPSFEEAKGAITHYDFIGNYKFYVSGGYCITVELDAEAGYDSDTIFQKISPCIDDISETEAQDWYDKTVKELKEFWEKYITETYFTEEEV